MGSFVITIFFVGIAAVVNHSPSENVLKTIVFPAAHAGKHYQSTMLMPHHTFLYLRGTDFPLESGKTAEDICTKNYSGGWSKIGPDDICTIELSGARIWTRTSANLVERDAFRKIPSFSATCPGARDLASRYTESPVDPDIVAAHVDVTGGTVSACKRSQGAFVTKLDVPTNDGVLYVEQNQRTLRILLNDEARVAIENKPDTIGGQNAKEHYGWYNFINAERINCPINPSVPIVDALDVCKDVPGIVEPDGQSVTGPECSNTNYP